MPRRYVCIHGHFYQPPRENAWLEAVEMQESAYPAHDWNDRVTQECYAPNAKARLLNDEGRIERTVSNYARMSFNFGPTLLAWMKDAAPETYRRIVASDQASAERFGGHGSAMAQAYNHAILPLCHPRDQRTQVVWGIRDFKSRFGREPEGMWLPETAVDTASLEALAEQGIAFTVLAPRQCAAVRPVGDGEWQETSEGVDPTRAYLVNLPSGRSIAVFFYDGPIAQAVAFEGLLNSGEGFAERLLDGFDDRREHDQIMHIATDGESYGHHHRHGEMALAAALERIEHTPDVELINYALYLERHPPTWEARLHENSSWSCAHGVERWRSDCGCSAARGGMHQRWRAPLRSAFDWLRDTVNPAFEEACRGLLTDPWAARDDYIEVILDRHEASVGRFLSRHAARPLDEQERRQVIRLMELQRHAMLMYTSCAWFFDDIAGIETVQVIQYAARVIELARAALGLDLEGGLLERLAQAPGNSKEAPDGRTVYERYVRRAIADLPRVAAHYAIHRLFEGPADRVCAYEVSEKVVNRITSGKARVVTGGARFTSTVDFESSVLDFCALHLGDHVVSCGVRRGGDEAAFAELDAKVTGAFDRGDFAEVLRLMDREFDGAPYSIASLFRDEQHAVVRQILETPLAEVEGAYRSIYHQHAPLARFLRSLDLAVPWRIQIVANFVLSQELRRLLEEPELDLHRAAEIVDEAARSGIELDQATVGKAAADAMVRVVAEASARGDVREACRLVENLVQFLDLLPFDVDLWPLQEHFLDHIRPRLETLGEGGAQAGEAADSIRRLGDALRVQV